MQPHVAPEVQKYIPYQRGGTQQRGSAEVARVLEERDDKVLAGGEAGVALVQLRPVSVLRCKEALDTGLRLRCKEAAQSEYRYSCSSQIDSLLQRRRSRKAAG